jgi:hypothetical protein
MSTSNVPEPLSIQLYEKEVTRLREHEHLQMLLCKVSDPTKNNVSHIVTFSYLLFFPTANKKFGERLLN